MQATDETTFPAQPLSTPQLAPPGAGCPIPIGLHGWPSLAPPWQVNGPKLAAGSVTSYAPL